MATADALSRAIHLIEVQKADREADPEYMDLYNGVEIEPEKYPMYRTHDGQLYKKNNAGELNFTGSWKIVLPLRLRQQALYECHDSELAAHGGVFKTLYRLRQDYFWPKMKREAIAYVRQCETCKKTKPGNGTQRAFMGKDRSPRKKFQMISMDFIGPLPRSTMGNQWLLVILDNFSKLTGTHAMKTATAEKTIELLRDRWILVNGCPETIILDNGSQFRANLFRAFAAKMKINLWFSANYHPQANPTEAVNHTIVKAIRIYTSTQANHKDWDKDLPTVTCAINASVHSAIDMSPHMAVFGEKIALTGNDHRLRLLDDDEEDMPSLEKFRRINTHITAALEQAYDQRARRYNLRARRIEYKVGDVVYKRNFKLSNAIEKYTAKLDNKFEVVRIHEKVGSNCYRLIDTSGKIFPGTYSTQDIRT